MNMFRKNGGFTLVELIVVIAILAILAAVAIPAYSGYISKAQEANDMTLLDSVKTAAVFAVMEKAPTATVTKIEVTLVKDETSDTYKGDYTIEVTASTGVYSNEENATNEIDISTYVPGGITFKSSNAYAVMEGGKWTLKPTAPSGT